MNQQRRLVLKAIGASGFFAAGYGTCFYLQSRDLSAPFDINNWSQQLVIAPIFSSLEASYPNAYENINQHIGFTGNSEEVFLDRVKKSIRRDYLDGSVLEVEDWRVSQTEVMVLVAAIQLGVAVVKNDENKTIENAPFEEFLNVTSWGPQETYQGVKFNEQPNGHCGMWINAKNITGGMEVYIGGNKSHAFMNESGLTTGIYEDVDTFINTVGGSDIVVYDTINHRKQLIGTFQVLPPFEFHLYDNGKRSQVFGVLRKWGPQKAEVGEVFNEQSPGIAAFWVKINSQSSQLRLAFNGHSYKATVRNDLVTCSFMAKNIPDKPGYYPVHLISNEFDEKLHVGDFQIE